jgi:hypothetical protein
MGDYAARQDGHHVTDAISPQRPSRHFGLIPQPLARQAQQVPIVPKAPLEPLARQAQQAL